MIEHFKNVIEGLSHPPIRHAAMVHFPIALATISLGIAVASAILRKNVTLKWLTLIVLLLLVGASFIARQSGEDAEHFNSRLLSDSVHEVLEEHEDMGNAMWLFAASGAFLALIAALLHGKLQAFAAWLTALACLASMAWVTVTAHLGGMLVYRHGVGTLAADSAPPATQPSGTVQTNSPTATAEQMAFFRDRVSPILAQNCITCHNPRRVAAGKSGNLDQTSRDGLLKGGKSGPAITPGNPDASLLIHRVRGDLPGQDVMPPDGRLTDAQIATLVRWIEEGAVWVVPATDQPPE